MLEIMLPSGADDARRHEIEHLRRLNSRPMCEFGLLPLGI